MYCRSLIVLFQISPNKASGLLFIFFRLSKGHVHYLNNEIRISWVPMRPSTVFFSCKMPEKLTRKAGLEVCGWSLCPIFNPEKKPTFEQKLICMYVNHLEALFSLYFSYKGCFCLLNGLPTWVGAYEQS